MSPVDYLIGTAGLGYFFGTKRLKLTGTKLQAAERFDQYIKARAKQWINLKRPAPPPKMPYSLEDYDTIIAALDNPMEANPDISGLPVEYQTDFIAKYMDIRTWLEDSQPAIKFSGGLIARELPPSDSEKSKFLWAANVLDDMTRVFDLLDAGCITPIETMALRDVYPEFVTELLVTYINTAIDMIIKQPYSALDGWQMLGLSSLAGVPVTSFEDVMTWQQGFQEQPKGPPPASKVPNMSDSAMTDQQKISMR